MNVESFNVEKTNMMVHASEYVGDSEDSEGRSMTPADIPVVQENNGILEPQVGLEFESEDAAKAFYNEYARHTGFNIKICQTGCFQPDSTVTSRQFVCAKEGSKRRPLDACEALLRIELNGKKWAVTKFVKGHNHSLEISNKVHNSHPCRHFGISGAETYQREVSIPRSSTHLSTDENRLSCTSPEANCGAKSMSHVEAPRLVKYNSDFNYTLRPFVQKRMLGKDAQNMLDYFKKMQVENPGFFYAIQLDEDNRMTNVFWTDARSRTAYSRFGDAIALGFSFRVKESKVPFAPFTGVNHHGQAILFGCALLQDESEASFLWLFRTFLTAMGNHHPVSIVTDQHRGIQAAVSQVFMKARHCISRWDILREGEEQLAHVCQVSPSFQMELYNCINLTETIEEFESSWASIVDKYDLRLNDWIQSVYNSRRQWVPVYFRDTFFAALSPNQGVYSVFDKYFNQLTPLPMFFRQYERAMEYWFEKEIEADLDTNSNTPVLRTPSPMEKQAVDLYTRRIFSKFQEEFVETFVYTANRIDSDSYTSTYRVAKFEDDHRAYKVILNCSDVKATCSCQMFEYSGILCRHILTVFTVSNVLTLPSHYILTRWTRNAKIVASSDKCSEDHLQELMASGYNILCQEAIRYAEEEAMASETCKTTHTGPKGGQKRIGLVKKNVAKSAPQTSQVGANGCDDKKTYVPDTPSSWPQPNEVTHLVASSYKCGEDHLRETIASKCNILCQEAISYAEEGAIASETCKAAFTGPKGQEKIGLLEKNVAKSAPQTPQVGANGCDDKKTYVPDTPSLWSQPNEVTRHSDLNDSAIFPRPVAAKIVASSDKCSEDQLQESMASRCNILCQEAIMYAEIASETCKATLTAPKGQKKIGLVKKNVAKSAPQTPLVGANGCDDKKTYVPDTASLWPQPNEVTRHTNLNESAIFHRPVADFNLLEMAPVSFQRNNGHFGNTVAVPCLKSMTWVMEKKDSGPANRVAVIKLKLQDYSKSPAVESKVKFQLSRVTLEPILRSMVCINEQLSTPTNKVAVINLKLQDAETTTGELEVKFQVSKDALGAMLRSMAYIRVQLSAGQVHPQPEPPSKKRRKCC